MNLILISLFFTAIIIYKLPSNNLQSAYIIMGHAHFLLTYIKRLKNSAINIDYLKNIMVYFAILVASFLASNLSQRNFTIFVSVFFLLHHFFDEMKILKIEGDFSKNLLVLLIILNFTIFGFYFKYYIINNCLLILNMLVIAVQFIKIFIKKNYDYYLIYLLLANLIILAIFKLDKVSFSIDALWSFIIIYHYIIWYIKIADDKYRDSSRGFFDYIKQIFFVNLGLLIFWFFYKKMPLEKEISDYFFSPNAFFVWTLMHLIFTLRKDDYKSTIKALLDFNVYKANKSEKI